LNKFYSILGLSIVENMSNILNKRYSHFTEKIQNNSIENYFGIKNDQGQKLKVELSRTEERKFVLHVKYIKKCDTFNFNLPIEIINTISSYGNHYIDLTMEISFPTCYPFQGPTWRVIQIQHNIQHSLDLTKYYKYVTRNHNKQYNDYWSPAVDIEKDILDFIRKINHFDYLFEQSLF